MLKQPAQAGTLESSDARVIVAPNPGGGIVIEIDSPVMAQFGRSIRASVESVLARFGVAEAVVTIADKGALDAVIRARLMTAICRAADISFDWKEEDGHAA